MKKKEFIQNFYLIKEASILFLNVRLKNQETRHKLFKRLIKEYSSIIDFHLINP